MKKNILKKISFLTAFFISFLDASQGGSFNKPPLRRQKSFSGMYSSDLKQLMDRMETNAHDVLHHIRVLSVDGGGVRGVIVAKLLADLEKQTGKRIVDLFDVFVGTSTGGIIVLALNVPDQYGNPRYTAEDVLKIYEKMANQVFKKSLSRKVLGVKGLLRTKYSSKPLEALLKNEFGTIRLSKSIKDVIIPSFNISNKSLFLFNSLDAKMYPQANYTFWEAARATSAAPTFFKPLTLTFRKPYAHTTKSINLVDGGIGANNPALLGYMAADALAHIAQNIADLTNEKISNGQHKNVTHKPKISVVSISTGRIEENVTNNYEKGRGIDFLKDTLQGFFNVQTETTNLFLDTVLNFDPAHDIGYFRIIPHLPSLALQAMDNPNNVPALEQIADETTQTKEWQELIATLNAQEAQAAQQSIF